MNKSSINVLLVGMCFLLFIPGYVFASVFVPKVIPVRCMYRHAIDTHNVSGHDYDATTDAGYTHRSCKILGTDCTYTYQPYGCVLTGGSDESASKMGIKKFCNDFSSKRYPIKIMYFLKSGDYYIYDPNNSDNNKYKRYCSHTGKSRAVT